MYPNEHWLNIVQLCLDAGASLRSILAYSDGSLIVQIEDENGLYGGWMLDTAGKTRDEVKTDFLASLAEPRTHKL